MRWLVALIFALLASIAAPSVHARSNSTRAEFQAGAEISGTVVLADSPSTPARHVRVMITGPDVSNMITDDSGRFTFTGLSAGKYFLSGSKPGYAMSTYGGVSAYDEPLQIVLAPGQRVTNLQLPLMRGSVIAGTIVDRTGAPIAGAEVSLSARINSVLRALPTVKVRSNDDGTYRLFGLSAGDYVVSASFEKSRTYYPSSSNPTSAALVTVSAAEERSGIDILMQPNTSTTISGTVIGIDGQPANGVTFNLRPAPADESVMVLGFDDIKTSVSGEGVFAVENVPPGNYILIASRGSNSPLANERGASAFEAGTMTVAVDGQPVSGLTLAMHKGTTVSGTLTLDVLGRADRQPELRLAIAGAVAVGGGIAVVEDDGSWTMSGVMPGRYRLASAPRESGEAARKIRSATLNGRDILETPFDVGSEPIKGISVTITDKLGSVRGTLTNSAGVPATNFRIIVFPADRAQWTRPSLITNTQAPDSNGDWVIPNLLPGEYRVAAIAGRGIVTLTPELLEQLAAASTTASITANNVVVVNLRVER